MREYRARPAADPDSDAVFPSSANPPSGDRKEQTFVGPRGQRLQFRVPETPA